MKKIKYSFAGEKEWSRRVFKLTKNKHRLTIEEENYINKILDRL